MGQQFLTMVMEFNFFESVEHLEPKCPKCASKIEYDVTTKWDDTLGCHVCKSCGAVLE